MVDVFLKFYENYFNKPPVSSGSRNLGRETANAFKIIITDLRTLSVQTSDYPFLEQLNPIITKIKDDLQGKDYSWYLKELPNFHESLLKTKEDLIDPIQTFMQGQRKEIYLKAKSFVEKNLANKPHIESNVFDLINDALNDPECYKGDVIQTMNSNLGKAKKVVEDTIKSKRTNTIIKVDTHKSLIEDTDGYKDLTSDQKMEVNKAYEELKQDINGANLIDSISGKLPTFENGKYQELLDMLFAGGPNTDQYINHKDIQIKFKALITSKEDIDSYFEMLKEAYLKELKAGKKIQL